MIWQCAHLCERGQQLGRAREHGAVHCSGRRVAGVHRSATEYRRKRARLRRIAQRRACSKRTVRVQALCIRATLGSAINPLASRGAVLNPSKAIFTLSKSEQRVAGTCGMRIHIGDIGRPQRAVRERAPHRQRGAGAVLRRLRDVVRVAREAVAAHLHI